MARELNYGGGVLPLDMEKGCAPGGSLCAGRSYVSGARVRRESSSPAGVAASIASGKTRSGESLVVMEMTEAQTFIVGLR